MRIALVNMSLSSGRGSDLVMCDLAELLGKRHQVDVYVLRKAALNPLNVNAIYSPHSPKTVIGAWKTLIKLCLSSNGYDAVHCHHALISLILPRKNLITTYHGYRGRMDFRLGASLGPWVSKIVRDVVIRAALRRSRAITIVSKSLAAEVEASGMKPTLVYNGVPQLNESTLEAGARRSYFLYVGRLDPDKNVEHLLEAYVGARVRSPLLVVGDGSDRSRLISRFAGERVRFLGTCGRSELSNLYAGALAFVTASTYETFCLPVIEAAQLGCPSLGPASGALPEVIRDGVTGLLYNERDFTQKIHKIEMMTDAERESLSEACKLWAGEFSWDSLIKSYEAIYQQLSYADAA